ncbi:MAG: GrdX family protein [Defluviitaleaceae bacterium]|nr:GrdX family protein [Defluviitaleaceae bacterium]
MGFVVITNNTMLKDKYDGEFDVLYHNVSLREIFVIVRDKVHAGHEILTHPMSGSVKPNETPFKTVFITKEKGKLNMDSVSLIEGAIATCDKFVNRDIDYGSKTEDFQLIDLSLAESALASLRAF